jgi:hypothetical protein
MENNFNKYLKIYNELKNLNTEKINKFKSFTRGFKMASEAAKKSTCGRKDVGAAIFQLNKKGKPIKLLGVGSFGGAVMEGPPRVQLVLLHPPFRY